MSQEQLYRKETRGKTVRYVPVEPEPADAATINFTDSQCVTAAATLGVTLLLLFEKHMPAHKKVARKIKAVSDSILELYQGTGEAIDDEIAELICKTWDRTMKQIATETEA